MLQVATIALAAVVSAALEPQVLVHHTDGAVVPEEPHSNKVCSLSTSIFFIRYILLSHTACILSRHGYRSKKFPAATYVRDYFINFTKSPKKLKKCVIFCNRNWLEVYYYKLPYNQGQ